jgi:hypothetical protein
MRANNVPREANKAKRRAALAIDQAVVLGTPVDTGTARSGWIVNLDQASDELREAYVPLQKGDISERANAEAAIAQGKKVIAQAKPEQEIHITNNRDYIRDLNDGSSAQAPAGFIEEAVDAGAKAARSAQINTGKRS